MLNPDESWPGIMTWSLKSDKVRRSPACQSQHSIPSSSFSDFDIFMNSLAQNVKTVWTRQIWRSGSNGKIKTISALEDYQYYMS